MNNLYEYIFKRKSFHLFRNNKTKELYKDKYHISDKEIEDIYNVFKSFKKLVDDIKVDIRIVKSDDSKRGEEYTILLYSEKKDNYLGNIGYIGEQLDLYLVSKNIGTLWYGIGKCSDKYNGLDFITTILICKVPNDSFRKDMFKSKRKNIDEIWDGNNYLDIANIVRFSPSSCNTQPWKVIEENNSILVYRYRKPDKRGIMPKNRVIYQNLIDIGIFILFLSIVLDENNINYNIKLFNDNENNYDELVLNSKFEVIK